MKKEMKDYPEPNESWLHYFRRTRKFCCLVLLAWSEVEFHIDQIIAKEFGLFHEDKKAQILLELPFWKKLEFLKKQGVVYQDEYDIIKKFQKRRNDLFHDNEPPFVTLSDTEKDTIMDNAVEAAQLVLDIGLGCHEKRLKE